ncbi:hypothetical protein FI667_g5980, partial [Globisporangium splendens]
MVLSKFASLSVFVAGAAVGVCAALDDYVVPAVDFSQLGSGADAAADTRTALLQAMQKDGIVALQNVPQYAALREKYLTKAAACAVTAKDNRAEFLLYRKLTDGTKRYTISTESGRKLSESGKETLEHCPGYLEVYQEFSKLVEDTVADIGKALDATQALHIATGSELALTARELMEESVHLDHFHAYQAPDLTRKLSSSYRESTADLSLEMHTDNGLMIAMTAPEYFDVADSGEVRSKNTRSEDAGLIIQTAEGKTVRPVLQADELVLMLGSGVDQWIKTTPKLHPVLHGMRFPRGLSYGGLSYADGSNVEDHKVLRAWFGKMILMNSEHVMQNTGMSYGEYANHTTRYLMESNADLGFAAVACPPDRRLQASDSKCMTKICTLKAGADSSQMLNSCQITCNHDSTDDAKLCQANCQCETQTVAGHNCWMLCVADLSTDVCPGEQKCNDAFTMATLAMKCSAGTVAPTTTTTTSPSPSPKPSTTAPATTRPTTTTPSTSASSTSSGSEDGNAKASPTTDDPEIDTVTAPSGSSSEDTSIEDLTTDSSASSANSTRTPTPSPTASSAAAVNGWHSFCSSVVGAALVSIVLAWN